MNGARASSLSRREPFLCADAALRAQLVPDNAARARRLTHFGAEARLDIEGFTLVTDAPVMLDRNALRQCLHCGLQVPAERTQCPNCREALPLAPAADSSQRPRRTEIRRGLLYMLLAGVIHYYAGGYSKMDLPFPIHPVVTVYLSPMLFLSGVGLIIYGLFTWRKE